LEVYLSIILFKGTSIKVKEFTASDSLFNFEEASQSYCLAKLAAFPAVPKVFLALFAAVKPFITAPAPVNIATSPRVDIPKDTPVFQFGFSLNSL
jgi:hypothetical protein